MERPRVYSLNSTLGHIDNGNVHTRKLCYRKDDRAMRGAPYKRTVNMHEKLAWV